MIVKNSTTSIFNFGHAQTEAESLGNVECVITEIERYAIHDGFGLRTVIFLKGCPLRCRWCANPETQEFKVEMGYFQDKCIGCNRCTRTCLYNAIQVKTDGYIADRCVCQSNCYDKREPLPCTTECYSQARKPIGEKLTVREIFDETVRDMNFYAESDGGITISGGEPLAQPEAVYALLRYHSERWVNTAIETCGIGSAENYRKIAPYLNLLFLDIKSVNPLKHKEWTGADNSAILENAILLNQLSQDYDFEYYIRVPIIPGFNDSTEEIVAIADFVKQNLPNIHGVELLPYHKLGRSKYQSLGLTYMLNDLETPTKTQMTHLNQIIMEKGIKSVQF